MAINKNHEFEELATGPGGDSVKCGIVEKNVSPERVEFLKKILEYNKFTVIVVPSPPPKAAPAPKPTEASPDDLAGRGEEVAVEPTPEPAPTFTLGVTDYTFNTINAIFGRLLKTPAGQVVTLAYWNQEDNASRDEIPYYEKKI